MPEGFFAWSANETRGQVGRKPGSTPRSKKNLGGWEGNEAVRGDEEAN